jgi:hypothetical protein
VLDPLPPRLLARLPYIVAALVALAFLGCLLASTQGHFVPPVVDLYVVCQYAKAFAEGHPFHYNAGEPASTGSTSLLHTLVLGAAHAAGLRGEALVAFAILLGGALYFTCVALSARLARRLADGEGEREALLAALLVALGGPLAWGFFYGSDVALFTALSLGLGVAYVEGWSTRRAGAWAAVGTLVALSRPEGLPLGLLLGIAWVFGPGRGAARSQRLAAALPALAGLGVPALQRALTGAWLGSSLADKSLVAAYGWLGALALAAEYGVDVLRGLLLGFYPSQPPVGLARGWASLAFPPLGLALALVALARPAARVAAALRVWSASIALVAALGSLNVFMGVHFNRYLLWTFPTLLVLVALGLSRLTRLVAREDARLERALFRCGAGLLVLLGGLSTLRFATLYGEMAGEVLRRDVATAEWIRARLPPGVALANVATSVEYLTGHRNLNLHGVTSPAFFGNTKAEREAGTFEALGRLPPAERPEYLLTSVATQEASPSLRALADAEPLYRSLSFADELLILRLRWDVAERNRRFYLPATAAAVAGLREVDRLNLGDTRDERAHGYAFRSRLGDLALHGTVRVAAYAGHETQPVVDAGRVILGAESFRVRSERGRDLVVVMRTAPDAAVSVLRPSGNSVFDVQVQAAGLVLSADGHALPPAARRPAPGWDEWVLRVPASAVGDGVTRLELRGRYAAFFYWFFQ